MLLALESLRNGTYDPGNGIGLMKSLTLM
jgi:hypothetical protein